MEENFRQDKSDQDDDDDVLSLSDLPIYGDDDTPEKEDFPVKEYTSSLSFEFFSEEWSSTILSKDSTDHKDTSTVIFSGQIIPHDEKTPAASSGETTLVIENKKGRKFGYRRLSIWNFRSLTGPATSGRRYVHKSSYKDEVPVVAVPRAKWYLFIFGWGRFPAKMHVRDLRRRQGSSTSKRSSSGSVGGDIDWSKSSDGDGGKGVGWWTLIRVLGCGGGCGGGDDHANTVPVAKPLTV